jgi:hypothetical protein
VIPQVESRFSLLKQANDKVFLGVRSTRTEDNSFFYSSKGNGGLSFETLPMLFERPLSVATKTTVYTASSPYQKRREGLCTGSLTSIHYVDKKILREMRDRDDLLRKVRFDSLTVKSQKNSFFASISRITLGIAGERGTRNPIGKIDKGMLTNNKIDFTIRYATGPLNSVDCCYDGSPSNSITSALKCGEEERSVLIASQTNLSNVRQKTVSLMALLTHTDSTCLLRNRPVVADTLREVLLTSNSCIQVLSKFLLDLTRDSDVISDNGTLEKAWYHTGVRRIRKQSKMYGKCWRSQAYVGI